MTFRDRAEYVALVTAGVLGDQESAPAFFPLLPTSFMTAYRSRPLRVLLPYRESSVAILCTLTGRPRQEVLGVIQEFRKSHRLRRLARRSKRLSMPRSSCEILYSMVRLLRPKTVLETGVASGLSSAVILEALESNSYGALYSIEAEEFNPDMGGKRSGYLVPSHLRKRWTMRIGDARVRLPELIGEVGAVDAFLHDSNHSYSHMTWELETVWESLRSGGVVLADNVNYHSAFLDFCKRVVRRPIVKSYVMGFPNCIDVLGIVRK